jgi:hypothetical protein
MKKENSVQKCGVRLLVPTSRQEVNSIELCGRHWALAEFADISDTPSYTCISYSWGTGRKKNVIAGGQAMSDRAIAAVETAIKPHDVLGSPQAIWIDALCMPHEEPARTKCLRSMGAIYRAASQVIVVLSPSCTTAMQKIATLCQMNEEELSALNNDDWVTRAWTYQEVANGKSILICAEGSSEFMVRSMDFLERIMIDATDLHGTAGVWDTALSDKYSSLNNFQEIIVENNIVEYLGRPAFQIMSAVRMRHADTDKDRVYPMIGVLSELPVDHLGDTSLSPAEFFRITCEKIGDYSFIFCTEPRSDLPGNKWRPVGESLTALVSGIHTAGPGLRGSQNEGYLHLDNVCLMKPGNVDPQSVKKLLRGGNDDLLPFNLPRNIHQWLTTLNFIGSGEYIELDSGYFFAQGTIPFTGELVVVSTDDVSWDGGGPALLVRSHGESAYEFCDVGVFIGKFQGGGKSIDIM